MNIFDIYRRAYTAALSCLIDHKIYSFPVDVIKIANEIGIRVVKNSAAQIFLEEKGGKIILDGDVWNLVYDDEYTKEWRRLTIAHELGHVFMGQSGENTDNDEFLADVFASRLLAPERVLLALNVSDAEDISRLCGIPLHIAENRADKIGELRAMKSLASSPLELMVLEQFKNFIEEHRFI